MRQDFSSCESVTATLDGICASNGLYPRVGGSEAAKPLRPRHMLAQLGRGFGTPATEGGREGGCVTNRQAGVDSACLGGLTATLTWTPVPYTRGG